MLYLIYRMASHTAILVSYGGREGSATSRVKKPKRQSKADIGNSIAEAAIQKSKWLLKIKSGYRNTCVAFQNLPCMQTYSSQESIGSS